MAFEYLMAWHLMNKRLDKFVKNLGRLGEFGYTALPPLYQEAMLIYATKYPVPLGDFSVNPEVQQRIKRFSDIFNRYGRNKEAAFSELAAQLRRQLLSSTSSTRLPGTAMNEYRRYLMVGSGGDADRGVGLPS
jgi:hypothetical protein